MTLIKPSRKEKKRYFLIKFFLKKKNNLNSYNLDFKIKKNIILYHYKKLFGSVGLAKARMLFFDKSEDSIIVRINVKEQNNLRLTLLSIKNYYIKEKNKTIKLTVYTKKTSGILDKIKKS